MRRFFLPLLFLAFAAISPASAQFHGGSEAVDQNTPLRVVTTNNRLAEQVLTPPAGQTMFQFRTAHQAGGPIRDFQFWFYNWYASTSAATTAPYEQHNVNSTTYNACYLEYAGTSVQITVGGQSSWVIPGNVAYVPSDALPSTSYALARIPRDSVVYVRCEGTITAGASIYAGTEARWTGTAMYAFNPANRINQISGTGPLTAPTGATQYSYAPVPMVAGHFTQKGFRAVVAVGDSIMDGQADNVLAPATVDGRGFAGRATVDANGKYAFALLHLTKPGDAATGWAVNHAFRSQFLQLGNILVEEFGTNNINNDGSTPYPVSTLLADSAAIWSLARAAGAEKVLRIKLFPKTTVFIPTALTSSGTIATATVNSSATYSVGQSIYMVGATPTAYNGFFTVSAIPDGTHVSWDMGQSASSPATLSTPLLQGLYPGFVTTAAEFNAGLDEYYEQGALDAIWDPRPVIYLDNSHSDWWKTDPISATAEGTHPSTGTTGGSGLLAVPFRQQVLQLNVIN